MALNEEQTNRLNVLKERSKKLTLAQEGTKERTKAELLGDCIGAMTSICNDGKKDVANLISTLIGEKVEVTTPKNVFLAAQVLIPTSDVSSESLPAGLPCIVMRAECDYVITITGKTHEIKLARQSAKFRMATEAEIEVFFAAMAARDSLPSNLVDYIIKLVEREIAAETAAAEAAKQ